MKNVGRFLLTLSLLVQTSTRCVAGLQWHHTVASCSPPTGTLDIPWGPSRKPHPTPLVPASCWIAELASHALEQGGPGLELDLCNTQAEVSASHILSYLHVEQHL